MSIDAELMPGSPIGIMDSGAGGLSVLQQIKALLPHESLLYAADSAHLPYGDKTPAFVRQRVNTVAAALVELGAKALVVACNTATAAAVESLRERYAMPVVGMEPGVKPAVQGSRSGVVGILATAGMAGSSRMTELVQRFAGERQVIVRACPGLVEQVERQALDTPETTRLLQQYLAPVLEVGADTVVLGCTHYPFLRPLIERLSGPGVRVIDTGEAVARRLHHLLQQGGLLNSGAAEPQMRFYTTAATRPQAELFSRLLGSTVEVEPLSARVFNQSPEELSDESQATT
ncbi:MAG: glutamate racemase [Gammaproteobacteria bacterium]|nr:glutamate racemase [Gammaproteobacteria bacterium]MCW8993186.1 glutamate racemase [Gammaproteobacteria bacterium]